MRVAAPLVVQAKDTYGNAVSGVAVTFAPATGGGSVSPLSATTGANGQASDSDDISQDRSRAASAGRSIDQLPWVAYWDRRTGKPVRRP